VATPTPRIRPWHAGQRAATGGGRFGGARHCECSHCLVTDSMAGGMGQVNGPGL
jgi:hypothetical protein